jgi:hypothetical protein
MATPLVQSPAPPPVPQTPLLETCYSRDGLGRRGYIPDRDLLHHYDYGRNLLFLMLLAGHLVDRALVLDFFHIAYNVILAFTQSSNQAFSSTAAAPSTTLSDHAPASSKLLHAKASWYGARFQGHETSAGETFNTWDSVEYFSIDETLCVLIPHRSVAPFKPPSPANLLLPYV